MLQSAVLPTNMKAFYTKIIFKNLLIRQFYKTSDDILGFWQEKDIQWENPLTVNCYQRVGWLIDEHIAIHLLSLSIKHEDENDKKYLSILEPAIC